MPLNLGGGGVSEEEADNPPVADPVINPGQPEITNPVDAPDPVPEEFNGDEEV